AGRGLELVRHVETRAARDFGGRRRPMAAGPPRRRVHTRADALAHEAVVGRMELDDVAAEALAVEADELGWVLVGAPRLFQHFGRAVAPPQGGEARRFAACAVR